MKSWRWQKVCLGCVHTLRKRNFLVKIRKILINTVAWQGRAHCSLKDLVSKHYKPTSLGLMDSKVFYYLRTLPSKTRQPRLRQSEVFRELSLLFLIKDNLWTKISKHYLWMKKNWACFQTHESISWSSISDQRLPKKCTRLRKGISINQTWGEADHIENVWAGLEGPLINFSFYTN